MFLRSEAIKGALPIGANQPQRPPFGLYAEKFSGTAFTTPRSNNLQTWLYRVLPAASHQPFEPYVSLSKTSVYQKTYHIPNQLRWDPFDLDNEVDVSIIQHSFLLGITKDDLRHTVKINGHSKR